MAINPNLTIPDSQRKMREFTAKKLGISMTPPPVQGPLPGGAPPGSTVSNVGLGFTPPVAPPTAPPVIPPTVPPAVPPTTPPVEPPTAPTAEQQLKAIQDRLLGTLTPGAEEIGLGTRQADVEKQLADLVAATQAGILGVEGQGRGITTGLVRGEQEKRLRQSGIAALPLQAQLANIQAKLKSKQAQRGAAADVATAEMKFETKRQEREAKAREAELKKSEPFTMGNRLLRVNPETGEVEELYKVDEENITANISEFNFAVEQGFTGGFLDYLSAKQKAETTVKPVEDPLDDLLSPTELKLFNAPAGSTMRDIIGQIPKTELTGVEKFNQEIALGKQFEGLVGDSRKASTAIGIINTSMTAAEKAMREGTSLNAASQGVLIAFQKLLDPTSVVRESEYARSGAGQSLWDRMSGTWEKLEKGGAGVTIKELRTFNSLSKEFLAGYENTAVKHAKRMQVIAERQGLDLHSILTEEMINLVGAGKAGSLEDYVIQNPQDIDTIEQALRDGFTDDEILEYLYGDFKPGSSGTPTATTDIKKVSQAIGQYESGGNYKARGPVVTSGQYKGERALGKYQIMPGNLPSWSKQSIGRVVSDQEFLNNPRLQDQIAQYKMGKILAQYGNVEDVASVWFSGRPVAKAGQARDVLGTSVPQYVKNITSIFNRLA